MDFTVLTDLQTGMEEFSRGMSELGDRNLSPDGGLCFSIDFLQPQGPPEVPPPLTTAPAARGASRSPPAKHAGAEEVRTEVKRPEGQVRSPLLTLVIQEDGSSYFWSPKNTHEETILFYLGDIKDRRQMIFHKQQQLRLHPSGIMAAFYHE